MPSSTGYFVKMIKRLREYEEVVLYENILSIEKEEQAEIVDFLAREYQIESVSYPSTPPLFDGEAALWAAKTVYIAAQLMLYRENKETELEALLPMFSVAITPSAILSADLSLRFLPDMILQLRAIESEDKLLTILDNIMCQWHYSGIRYLQSSESLDFTNITSNECLGQLYTDRVIEFKNLRLAKHLAVQKMIRAALGDLGNIYWSDFKFETTIHE